MTISALGGKSGSDFFIVYCPFIRVSGDSCIAGSQSIFGSVTRTGGFHTLGNRAGPGVASLRTDKSANRNNARKQCHPLSEPERRRRNGGSSDGQRRLAYAAAWRRTLDGEPRPLLWPARGPIVASDLSTGKAC